MACGIPVPWPEIEPTPPALEASSLNHWTAREVLGTTNFSHTTQEMNIQTQTLTWMYNFFKKILFIIFDFIAGHRLSLVAASGGYSSLRCAGFSLWWLLLLQSMGSRRAGFSSCGSWAQQLWHMGLVAPRHVGSSWTRDWTRGPCIGRQILNHCATKEVPDV